MDYRRRQGKACEKEIRVALEALQDKWKKFWWMRLQDHKDFYVLNKHLHGRRQPCDFIALFHGKFYGLEVKSSRNDRRYGLVYVQKHQKQSLKAIERAGGEGWILLSWRRWSHEPRKPNRLFGFRIKNWLSLERETLNEGMKSVEWKRIVQEGLEFRRKKGVWRLERLFGGV